MAPRKTSQAQQNEAPTATFPSMPGMEIWRDMMTAQAARFESMVNELERLERERHERTLAAMDDAGALIKSSLDYQRQLGDEWRKLALEAMSKSSEAFRA